MSVHLPRGAAVATALVSLVVTTLPLPAGAQQAGNPEWGTYLGGTDIDRITAVTQVGEEPVAVGVTKSSSLAPTATAGSRANLDIVVGRFDVQGPLISGYPLVLGGDGDDEAAAIATGPNGELYIVGRTTSKTLSNPSRVFRQPQPNSGTDAFLVRVSAAGVPDWFMFLSGSAEDVATGITLVGSNVYVSGWTNSSDFMGATSTVPAGRNGFLVRIEPTSTNAAVGWGLQPVIIGGAGDEGFFGVTADATMLYAVGTSTSTSFSYGNRVLNTYKGGASDALVAKVDLNAANLEWLLFVGGSGADEGNGIATGPRAQSFVVAGTTTSPFNLGTGTPLTHKNVFVAWVTPDGRLKSSQQRGGSADEAVLAVTTDPTHGNAYVGGKTGSSDIQRLDAGFDRTIEGGTGYREGFVWAAPPEGGDGWMSLVGGPGVDAVNSISLRSGPHLILGMETSSASGMPGPTGRSYDDTLSTGPDGYLQSVSVDTSPPSAGTVYDRRQEDTVNEDVETTTSTTAIYANWAGFFKAGGLARYDWAIGTEEDPVSVQPFTPVGLSQSAGNTALQLVVGQRYIVTVRAQDRIGLTSIARSNGVVVTLPDGGTPPPPPDGGTGGTDGGTGGTDGGTGEPDGGTGTPDGGTGGPDGGSGNGGDEDLDPSSPAGWGCASAGGAGLPLLLGLLALVLLARRLGQSAS